MQKRVTKLCKSNCDQLRNSKFRKISGIKIPQHSANPKAQNANETEKRKRQESKYMLRDRVSIFLPLLCLQYTCSKLSTIGTHVFYAVVLVSLPGVEGNSACTSSLLYGEHTVYATASSIHQALRLCYATLPLCSRN